MNDEQVEALLAAAEDGVALDGLEASRDGEVVAFSVPDSRYAGTDESAFRERAAEHAAYVEDWYVWTHVAPSGDDRRAFLRWLEDADEVAPPARRDRLAEGVVAEWGELRIGVGLADGDDDGEYVDGERRYDLRHGDDAGTDPTDLDAHEDPLDAREIAKHDDSGRYRPLTTAPSLRTGWRFPACSADDLVRAVECFYPATIANWYREREGDLDVTHWRETAQRQTGIYDLIDDLPREAIEWVAEACCVDSQCTKRREWDHDAGDEIAVDGGDGVYPCREPCSVVIAAARQWTILEGETERTYEFDLTPSEKRQLEELVDAVADGRVDEIREADLGDGANRYRARYLRAKRFDDDGEFGREADRAE